MKKILVSVGVALVIASEVFLLCTNRKLCSEIALKDRFLDHISDRYDAAETQFLMTLENIGEVINSNTPIKDTADNSTTFAEIANEIDGNFLICRYSDRMCRECVEHTISVFTDNMDSLDRNKIVFLAENSSRRVLKLNVTEFGLENCRVLNCANLGINAEGAMFPYIMAVDKDLRVLNVYFPTKSTHGTDYDYKHIKLLYDKLIKQ
ncbi:MAG: hypothetical protein J6U21_15615 [Bacteroidales bacterium]|nr:hypothetical protein [Bacteroidales bacterium]